MSSLLEHYKILGVNYGAGLADVTASYKRLCRIYHPDVSGDPRSEELMKRINIAYYSLREKFRREAAFRDRQAYARQQRRYGGFDSRASAAEARTQSADARKENQEAEHAAFSVMQNYFKAICAFDYSGAYNYLSSYDKRQITRESFIEWRKSVARLYQIREFRVTGGFSGATITFNDGKTVDARRFRVAVREENFAEEATHSGYVEKLVINERGVWKVFLGYRGVGELTRTFDERFEARRKKDVAKRWEEYYAGLYPEYNMFSMVGMRKAVSREIYRQKRFGGTLTFAVLSVKMRGSREAGQDELLRSAARTICAGLRETDIPAYAGDGVFAILFVELRKKNTGEIINRLVEKIRKNAGLQLGGQAEIEYKSGSWTGSTLADMDGLNKILKEFNKKM